MSNCFTLLPGLMKGGFRSAIRDFTVRDTGKVASLLNAEHCAASLSSSWQF